MMNRAGRWLTLCALVSGLLASAAACAAGMTLTAAIDAALRNDPILLALAAQTRADSEVLPKARAELLPHLSFQASESHNTSTQTQQLLGQASQELTRDYPSSNQSLSLTQSLLHRRGWMNYRQSEATVNASEATYASGLQQSIDRAVVAYAEKLRLEMELDAAGNELRSTELRLVLLRRLLDAGQTGLADVKTAEAEVARARVKREETAMQLEAANRELEKLTAQNWSAALVNQDAARPFAVQVLEIIEHDLAAQEKADIESHPEVTAYRLRYEMAQWETKKRQGDHFPTLDLVASLSRGKSASDVSIGLESTTTAVGVLLNVPLYSGGSVSSSVREALALRDKAEMELRNVRLTVQNDRARALAQLRTSLSRLSADLLAQDAADLTLQVANRRLAAGAGSEVDLYAARARKAASAATLGASAGKAITDYSKLRLAFGDLESAAMDDFSQTIALFFPAATPPQPLQ